MNFFKTFETNGFTITLREKPKELSEDILKRYKNIPSEYLRFLKQFEQIINKEDTVWFNSIEDFNEETKTDFNWNAFELMSLESFEDNDEESDNIRNFWNNHIPILMSVREYEYLAICLESSRYGEIVHGLEPEFEETTKVCDNFEQLTALMEKSSENQYLKNFVYR